MLLSTRQASFVDCAHNREWTGGRSVDTGAKEKEMPWLFFVLLRAISRVHFLLGSFGVGDVPLISHVNERCNSSSALACTQPMRFHHKSVYRRYIVVVNVIAVNAMMLFMSHSSKSKNVADSRFSWRTRQGPRILSKVHGKLDGQDQIQRIATSTLFWDYSCSSHSFKTLIRQG